MIYDNSNIRKLGKHNGVLVYHDPNMDKGIVNICFGQKYSESSYVGMASFTDDNKIAILDGNPKLYTEQERSSRSGYQIVIINNSDYDRSKELVNVLFTLSTKKELHGGES